MIETLSIDEFEGASVLVLKRDDGFKEVVIMTGLRKGHCVNIVQSISNPIGDSLAYKQIIGTDALERILIKKEDNKQKMEECQALIDQLNIENKRKLEQLKALGVRIEKEGLGVLVGYNAWLQGKQVSIDVYYEENGSFLVTYLNDGYNTIVPAHDLEVIV